MKKALLIFLFPLLSMGQTQIGADIDGEGFNSNSGSSVSLSGDGSTIAIGAPYKDVNGVKSGSVEVYKNISGIWTQIGTDINGETAGDRSGWSVSLSFNGNILAIGAPDNKGNLGNSGHVRVYENISGIWTQIGTDIDGEGLGDQSGYSVSISSDGTIIAIGAPYNSENKFHSGHVRVFKNISGIWTQIGTDIEGESQGDESGAAISLSNDGTTLAIGSFPNYGNGTYSGHVRVYKNILGIWTQIGVDINGEAAWDESGYSVSLSSDGTTLAVGAIGANGDTSGHVRVYKNIEDTWTQIGNDIDGESAGDWSGAYVSLSSDGTTLAIGSPNNNGNGIDSGSVRVYKNISGNWIKIGVDIDGEDREDYSGHRVSLSSDGTILAIGAPYNEGKEHNSGSVRVYNLSAVLSADSFVLAHFSVYPNPASEVVTISLQEGLTFEKVNVYNTLGQLVKTENKNVIVVNSLAKGSYFFEVITNKGKAAKQIIVQ